MAIKRTIGTGLFVANLVFASGLAFGAGQYGPGASDTEIKIGNTMPYSGPASAYGVIGKSETAYFNMINEQGGVNGRKINFISRDEVTARRKPSNWCASWSRKTRCYSHSTSSARRRTRPCKDI